MQKNNIATFTELSPAASKAQVYNFNYEWKFKLAEAFPLAKALDAWKDAAGRFFYDKEYKEKGWKTVGLPHTFNDGDLFVAHIEDAGSGQKRTFAFYRKWFRLPAEHSGKKVLIEFEGIRQTCYLYVNGKNLLNGEPYIRDDGVFIAEINAVISYIEGVTSFYDNKVNVFRIELP